MVRISGVDLPSNKYLEIALTYIKGIGKTSAKNIMAQCNIPNCLVKELNDAESAKLSFFVEQNYETEGKLALSISYDIKRLISINSYRGTRHKIGLPVRGQRTKSNAKTWKKMREKGKKHYIK